MLSQGFSAPGAFSFGLPWLSRPALLAPLTGSRNHLKVRGDAHPPSVLGAMRLRAGGLSQIARCRSLREGSAKRRLPVQRRGRELEPLPYPPAWNHRTRRQSRYRVSGGARRGARHGARIAGSCGTSRPRAACPAPVVVLVAWREVQDRHLLHRRHRVRDVVWSTLRTRWFATLRSSDASARGLNPDIGSAWSPDSRGNRSAARFEPQLRYIAAWNLSDRGDRKARVLRRRSTPTPQLRLSWQRA